MSFPRYPRYKESAVGWLRDIPAHWSVGQSRRLFALRKERIREGDRQLTASQKYGVIYQDKFMELEDQRVVQVFKGADILRHVEPNDFVISMRSFQGGIELCEDRGCISSAYVILMPCERVDTGFFRYLFKSSTYIQALQSTSNLVRDGQALRYDNFTLVDLPLVPLDEQSTIAAFLDGATAKIDRLVGEQRRLIELLKEKRQAVISHAVTKGLNPHAPMKPSGIEWLGEVPEHWKVCLLKRAFRSVEYGISDALESEGAVAILRMGNIENGKVITDDLKYIDSVDPGLLLRRGDLLYNRTNSLDLIGKVGMFLASDETAVSFASYLVRLRTVDESIPDYFAYLLNTEGILGLARSSAFVAIGQCNLNPTRYGQIGVAIPPKSEQAAIVEYLDKETAIVDALIVEAERAIDLLQEHRTALISAAVTGKIDVRGLAETEAA